MLAAVRPLDGMCSLKWGSKYLSPKVGSAGRVGNKSGGMVANSALRIARNSGFGRWSSRSLRSTSASASASASDFLS